MLPLLPARPVLRASIQRFSKSVSTEIDLNEVARLAKQASGNTRLLDVREKGELEKSGHIESALNVPMSELESAFQMSDDKFRTRYGQEKPDQKEQIVTFCAKGVRAALAQQILASKFDFSATRAFRGDFKNLKERL